MTKEKMLLGQIINQKIDWLTDQIDEFNKAMTNMIKDDSRYFHSGIDYSSELTNAIDKAKKTFTETLGAEIVRLKKEFDKL